MHFQRCYPLFLLSLLVLTTLCPSVRSSNLDCAPCTDANCQSLVVPFGTPGKIAFGVCPGHAQVYVIDSIHVSGNDSFTLCSGVYTPTGGCSPVSSTSTPTTCFQGQSAPDQFSNGVLQIEVTCKAPTGCAVRYNYTVHCVAGPDPEPPAPPPTPPHVGPQTQSLATGAIVGIIIGAIVIVALVIVGYGYLKRTRRDAALLQSLQGYSQVADTSPKHLSLLTDESSIPPNPTNWIASPAEGSANGPRSGSPTIGPVDSNYVVMLQDYSAAGRKPSGGWKSASNV